MRAVLAFILIIFILQLLCVPLQAVVEVNLKITVRPGTPWPPLPCYTKDLKRSNPLCIGEFTVPCSRHHIIPYSNLRDFWNRIIDNPEHLSSGLTFAWGNMIAQYKRAFPKTYQEDVIELIKAIQRGDIVHNESRRRPEGWDDFEQYWVWNGANLMIGPTNRSDDPGDNFENNSYVIVGMSAFDNLKSMNLFMESYTVNFTKKQVKTFAVTFGNVLKGRAKPYPLNPDNWTLKDGRYKIDLSTFYLTATLTQEDDLNDNLISEVIGTSFYAPLTDLLGENILGGYPVWKKLPPECIKTMNSYNFQEKNTFFENTANFYQSLSTGASLSASFQADYTMGYTLDATTQSISGGERKVKGLTMNIYSEASIEYIEDQCINDADLTNSLVEAFEKLPKEIEHPWLFSQWTAYQSFLDVFHSHLIIKVSYGSSLYQHCFTEESSHYSEHEFNLKACAEFAGPTPIGEIGLKTCGQFSQEEIQSASEFQTSSRLIVRGGSTETRTALFKSRNAEKIAKFLSEANQTHSPIKYELMPIWDLLKAKYLESEHFSKAVNLEAYYKGYLNFGCKYYLNHVELQKFTHNSESTPEYPLYECVISPEGCQDNKDCHYRSPSWCECRGDSCIRHYQKSLNTGTTREYAAIYEDSGWDWQGCTLSGSTCSCTSFDSTWLPIWSQGIEDVQFTSALREKLKNLKVSTRSEL